MVEQDRCLRASRLSVGLGLLMGGDGLNHVSLGWRRSELSQVISKKRDWQLVLMS